MCEASFDATRIQDQPETKRRGQTRPPCSCAISQAFECTDSDSRETHLILRVRVQKDIAIIRHTCRQKRQDFHAVGEVKVLWCVLSNHVYEENGTINQSNEAKREEI
jgi:hypothetical protein